MKAFITAVAGMATRFSEDLPAPIPKCIYNEGKAAETLLYRIVSAAADFDLIVIVTGFMADDVVDYAEKNLPKKILEKIKFVNNESYSEYGSGWSLYLGLKAVFDSDRDYNEIVFAEGDLYFSEADFKLIDSERSDVITVSTKPIEAKSAVALYFDKKNIPHYIFDTSHGELEIKEPFLSIYNSAQIWKFHDAKRLLGIIEEMSESDFYGTNLVVINKYFQDSALRGERFKIIIMKEWINCNTVSDFRKIIF